MKATAPAAELAQGYEALRAQATGQAPRRRPRGLAVLLCGGLASWMCACPPGSRARPAAEAAPSAHETGALTAGSAELVRLLAGMTLCSQRRRAA
jgi:hypothetical protein